MCPKQVCRDEKCEFRHPKSCKFDGKCKFFKRKLCVYKHIANDDEKENQDLEEKLRELEKAVSAEKQNVENLRFEVDTLKKALKKRLTKLMN